ncbi:MAG: hypothetical protein C4B58_07600 [Deltaproteobacteria bacterium]|nr:MAG: hypothetical protein C4B58_07600 [Deltaproteobacteria bacterium]
MRVGQLSQKADLRDLRKPHQLTKWRSEASPPTSRCAPYETVKKLIDQTSTKTGLKVCSNIIKKEYKTGRKYAADFKKNMRIIFDDYLGQWNYRAIPAEI